MEDKKKRIPHYLHHSLPNAKDFAYTNKVVKQAKLPTVCEEAKCPNRFECYSQKIATFLTLGSRCTRACPFCEIDFDKAPPPPSKDEAVHICNSIKKLGLKYVILTMVTRDDLELGGANAFVYILQTIKTNFPSLTIEVLTSDFEGNPHAIQVVLNEQPAIFNHNIETVERLSPKVRHKASYSRSLKVLEFAKLSNQANFIKSGLMVGLGETQKEVQKAMYDLKNVGVDIVTIGQYLQASAKKLKVKAFIPPEIYQEYEHFGKENGLFVYAGPLVRSSYNAASIHQMLQSKKQHQSLTASGLSH
ncbi:MAG: Lipoyl synthase 2 [Chlamydiae bacterium]|nr:Lipoyl synthase 2 [Chlamydiota bacterium]